MPAGRPRTTTPEKDELIELGKDLVAWASEETEEIRCRYCQWYCVKHGFLTEHWELMLQKPEFRGYYEQARSLISRRWIDGSINPSIAHRFLRVYCPEVKKDENDFESYKSGLRKDESKETVNADLLGQYNMMMDMLNSLQDARKIEDINNSDEAKS